MVYYYYVHVGVSVCAKASVLYYYTLHTYYVLDAKFLMSVCIIKHFSMRGMQNILSCALPHRAPPTCIKDVVDLLCVRVEAVD